MSTHDEEAEAKILMKVEQATPNVKVVRFERERLKPQPLKMYILVRESIDLGHAVLSVGHGVLAGHRQWAEDAVYQNWLQGSFRKVVCKVTDSEFRAAKLVEDHVVMTESGLDGEETCMVFKPRAEWPKPFRFFQLYK